jgi:hypothetical protein
MKGCIGENNFKWSEGLIARALALQLFNRKHLVVVPNCNWTGYECDLLAVTTDLRIIDVEVKISRADFKADAKKDKWWHREFKGFGPVEERLNDKGQVMWRNQQSLYEETPLPWPRKVWKHYYALPADIWREEMLEHMGSINSGILLLKPSDRIKSEILISCIKPAKPNREAAKITAEQAVDIARLSSLRMWESVVEIKNLQARLEAVAA